MDLPVKARGLVAVKVHPPDAGEDLLVEDGSVGAEEGVFAETTLAVRCADVEDLAFGLGIGIITLTITIRPD